MVDVTLDARRGSFHLQVACRFASQWTVIFGHSGAGKSTLLRLLAGLDQARVNRAGRCRIFLNDRLLADTDEDFWLEPGRRETALVAQQPALFPHLTVTQNVGYGLRHLDNLERATRVAEMLSLVEASHLAPRRPQHLSGGEAQRVALARALATSPRLLLLDEPFSALDGTASDALLVRLQSWLCDHNVQTILVTHDATDAYATRAEVALLYEGKLAALGPAALALAAERQRIIQRLSTNIHL